MPSFITQFFHTSIASTSSITGIITSHGSITTDVAVLLVLFFFFLFYGLYIGKSRIVSLIIAFYPALFIYREFPFFKQLTVLTSPTGMVINGLIIFLVFLIFFDIIIGRYIFSETVGGSVHFLKMAGFSIAAILLVMVLSYTTLNLDVFYNFSSQIDALLSTPGRIFIALLSPLLILFLL